MNDTSLRGRSARRRAGAAVICSVVAALIGGGVLAAPARASTTPVACTAGSLMSTSGSGVVEIGSGPDLAGLHCGVTVITGRPAPTPSAPRPPVGEVVQPPSPVATVDPTRPTTTTDPDLPAGTPAAQTAEPAPSTPASAPLSTIRLERSAPSVYPVKDGYLDTVRFMIRGLDASGHLVPVQGTAVLSKGSTVVKRWTLDGSTTVLAWDGRVKHVVRTGVYTLVVTAWTADGTKDVQRTKVRVLAKHVERRAVTIRSNVGSRAERAAMPGRVLKAFAKGRVTVRVRTDARVTGPAKLVFTSDGVSRSVALRNGVHTTRALSIPKGFEQVTIEHRWAKGDAELRSVKAIWTYYALVK